MEERYLTEGGRERRIQAVKYYNEELDDENVNVIVGVCLIGLAAAASASFFIAGVRSEQPLFYLVSTATGLTVCYQVKSVIEGINKKAGIKEKIEHIEDELAIDDQSFQKIKKR